MPACTGLRLAGATIGLVLVLGRGTLPGAPAAGEHAVTSRAIDSNGQVQPTMDDPRIANKHTYWESNGQVTRHIRIA